MSAVTLNAAATASATKVSASATRRSGNKTTVASRGARRVVASFASASANDNNGFAVSTRADVRRRVTTRQASSKAERAMKRRGENIVTDAAAARYVCVVASRRSVVDCRFSSHRVFSLLRSSVTRNERQSESDGWMDADEIESIVGIASVASRGL